MSVAPLARRLPSMITRTWALLPSIAAVELGTDVITAEARIGDSADGRGLDEDARIGAPDQAAGRDQIGNRLVGIGSLERDDDARRYSRARR